ncbi:peptide chain release factor N(5)-glutamine methyltransferase [Patescibacteria group bacterium]|nr:peptide chain release factor N(5)-glutamine methyltransferase [Patescibacteria group bacterium]MBU4512423.1 peptide chain release factor N(5)-glutamine methyltransferase [Patescibacteria group bacterium]MCG2692718.1 peptide chain release factor N(5)-glutamine methyltransferase [Candidatus Parcubacteria bacterium]
MTIYKALAWGKQKLAQKSTSAELDAEVLLSYTLKKSKEWIFANPQLLIINYQLSKYKRLINRRAKGEPVAYLTKNNSFYGLDFYVDERVLIPRPETEMLVEETLKRVTHNIGVDCNQPLQIVDVGTGSGCIAVAIAKNLTRMKAGKRLPAFRVNVYATDISKDALTVARKNSQKHKVKIKFLQGDLLEPIFKKRIKPTIIAANLPYLKPSQIKGDIKYEPRKALVGGKDGLEYYKRLLRQASQCKKQETRNKDAKEIQISNFKIQTLNCLFEINPSQSQAIKKLIKKYLPKSRVETKKDLAGWERMVIVTTHDAHITTQK